MKKATTFLLVLGLVVTLLGAGMLGGCGEEAKEPTVTVVNPGSGWVGETLSVTITGTYLDEASAVSFGAGITVTNFSVESETEISASITIAATATTGSRNVAVTTPDGTATKTGAFIVNSPLAPSVTGISPDSGEQTETLDVTITGTNFISVSDVSLGAGVTVNSFTTDSDTQITANITIAPDATEAVRDVSVTNPSGTGVGGGIFTVKWPAALDEIIAAAQAEGVLNVVTPDKVWKAELANVFEQILEEKYGIDVTINFIPGPGKTPQAGMLIQEYQAGEKASTDIFDGVDTLMPTLHEAGVLMSYEWKELFPFIPDECIDIEGTSIEIATVMKGITYNTDLISEDEVPQVMTDVLGKGWFIASVTSAAGLDRLAYIAGYGVVKSFVEDLSEELAGLVRRPDEVERIALGEFTLLILDNGDASVTNYKETAPDAPVAHAPLEDMPMMNHNYMGIPKHSEHPNMAVLFLGLLWSPEGQQQYNEICNRSHHLIEGTHMNQVYNELIAEGRELVIVDAEWCYERIEVLNAYKAEFQTILAGE